MRIRRATFADLKAMQEVEEACFSGLPEHCTLGDFADLWSKYDVRVYVAGRPAVVVGMVATNGRSAEIMDVAVAPPARRRGLARKMVLYLLDKVGAYPVVTLQVRRRNPAVKLYRELGFRVTGSPGRGWYDMKLRR